MWLCVPFTEKISIDLVTYMVTDDVTLRYDYRLKEDNLVPLILTDTLIAAGFQSP